MKRRLPPLNAIIAFEAAARLKSFKAAAAYLLVTPSAISHQVRTLEDWLGTKLFERGGRTTHLTSAGERYVAELTQLLDCLEIVTRNEQERAQRQFVLRLQTTDSFANRWLVARLPRFQQQFPNITPQVLTFHFLEDFRHSEVDLAVLFGAGNWRNSDARLLLAETIFPVCNPSLLKDIAHKGRHSLAALPLICDDNLGASWNDWFAVAGEEVAEKSVDECRLGPRFNHSHLALKAAELGDGVALASKPLVMDALNDGKLIAPFTAELSTGCGYYLVLPDGDDVPDRCLPFVEWLCAQTNPALATSEA